MFNKKNNQELKSETKELFIQNRSYSRICNEIS